MTKEEAKRKKIEEQVERWDIFARIIPTVFLVVNVLLVLTEAISFETAFWTGLVLFGVTAVTWWFWTLFTITHLVQTLNRASKNLAEVRTEFLDVTRDVEAIKDDK